MAFKGVTFNGKHSSTVEGLRLSSETVVVLPSTTDEYTQIEKRAGSILDSGEAEDVYRELRFHLYANDREQLKQRIRQVANWLHSDNKVKLQIDDENVYYMAKVVNGISLENRIMRTGEFTVTFRCDPFAVANERTVTNNITTNNQVVTIVNNGTVSTQPIIRIKNNGSSAITDFTLEFQSVEG